MNGASRGAGLIVARVLVGLGLLAATLWVLEPFLVPSAWAAIIAYVTWPVYARLRAWTKRPALTAGLVTATFALVVAIPVGWLLVVRDATLLRLLEIDLRRAARLRVLSQVYLAVAHDLKAPLNGMVLNLELLRESLADGAEIGRDKQRRWVEVLERELVRLRRSLETLLAQTAPASDELERFDLRSTVEEIEDLLAPQARRQQVRLVTDLPAAPVTVEGHRDHLKQALLNVAINGLEVLGEGGTLELALRGDGEAAALAVRDTGPGISPELRQRIFDMHFTTKDNGTGIGLYVARSVVESEGGAIDVADTGPDGTTFMVRLPLAPTAGEEVSA